MTPDPSLIARLDQIKASAHDIAERLGAYDDESAVAVRDLPGAVGDTAGSGARGSLRPVAGEILDHLCQVFELLGEFAQVVFHRVQLGIRGHRSLLSVGRDMEPDQRGRCS